MSVAAVGPATAEFIQHLISRQVDFNRSNVSGKLTCSDQDVEEKDVSTMLDSVDFPQPLGSWDGITFIKQDPDAAQHASVKQILSGASTSLVMREVFDDVRYDNYLLAFYKPLHEAFQAYLAAYNATNGTAFHEPFHACFLYKGGNLFRMYMTKTMGNRCQHTPQFLKLLERSDADFSLYVNSNVGAAHYNQMVKDMQMLSIHCLEQFRAHLREHWDQYFGIPAAAEAAFFDAARKLCGC
jgi:hypothetical protein